MSAGARLGDGDDERVGTGDVYCTCKWPPFPLLIRKNSKGGSWPTRL